MNAMPICYKNCNKILIVDLLVEAMCLPRLSGGETRTRLPLKNDILDECSLGGNLVLRKFYLEDSGRAIR